MQAVAVTTGKPCNAVVREKRPVRPGCAGNSWPTSSKSLRIVPAMRYGFFLAFQPFPAATHRKNIAGIGSNDQNVRKVTAAQPPCD